MKNKFTEAKLLTNEASVEDLFASRLIRDLGYGDADIAQKASIPPERIMLGSKKVRYSPDYILSAAGKPRVVIDAKGPEEKPVDWVGQCVSYCATLNRRDDEENPVGHFVITNGLVTLVFAVDQGKPLVELTFKDCIDGNPRFERVKELLKPSAVVVRVIAPDQAHEFKRLRLEEVNAIFSWCHQHIYRKDNLSQAAGFEEFVKLVFLKLLSDRHVRDHPRSIAAPRCRRAASRPPARCRPSSRPLAGDALMRLISATPSPYARKVRIALHEKGIPFDLQTEVPWHATTATPRYNPLEKLPVLILDDGEAVYESRFILEWIEAKHPTPPLLPEDVDERLLARKLEVLCDGTCDAFVLMFFEQMREPDRQSAEWIARQRRKVDGGVREIARLVGDRDYAVGDRFSLGDIAAATVVGYLAVRWSDYPWRAQYPSLAAYSDRMERRPSFRATVPSPQQITEKVV